MTRTFRFLLVASAVLAAGCQSDAVDLSPPSDVPVRTAAVVRTSESIGTGRVTTTRTAVTGAGLRALDVLATIPVAKEHHAGYERDRFGYPADLDGDGCNTRAEVLIRDSLTPAQVDPSGCAVVAGDWRSPYDGVVWSDPAEVQIDHVVALSEAWDSGAWAWDAERLIAYGNDLEDPRSLRAVTGGVNSEKGNKDPSNWIPSDPADVCPFLADWIAIKARWGLSMDQSEFGRIRNLLTTRCPDASVAAWPGSGVATTVAAATAPLVPVPLVSVPERSSRTEPARGSCDPSYPSVCIPPSPPDLDCADVPYRRFAVLAPDPHRFDADHDGVGCER